MYDIGVESERRATILLVEDNLDEEALIMRAVRRSGMPCQILVAHTASEAIDYLHRTGDYEGQSPARPDVVVTDFRVPPEGGASLVTAMRSHPETALIPIVVFSGSASGDEILELYRLGANSFLEKPLEFDDFCSTITRLASYWGGLNLTPRHYHPSDFTSVL